MPIKGVGGRGASDQLRLGKSRRGKGCAVKRGGEGGNKSRVTPIMGRGEAGPLFLGECAVEAVRVSK